MSLTSILNTMLQVTGLSMIMLALGHAYLPKLLNWKDDLDKLTSINKEVFVVHSLFIVVGILLLGGVCLFFSEALVQKSQLALIASACFAMCWLSRLICQFITFSGDITTSRKVDRVMRIAGTLVWIFYTAVFTILFLYQSGLIGD